MSDTVLCKKCGTENPLGQDHCQSCGSLLKGHKFGFDKHPENINTRGTISEERKEEKARELVEEEGLEWDDLSATTRLVVIAAVGPKATNADRRLMLQQLQALKPAPKIGRDKEEYIESVVIDAGQIENAEKSLAILKNITKRRTRGKAVHSG